MYRNGIFPHEVRRALDGQISRIRSSIRKGGAPGSDPEIQALLQPLYEKRDSALGKCASRWRSNR
jgi:hypothetical protein